jgi:hypothetical protein
VKIVHLEDEWPTVRPIAHWLHDKIFRNLPPELGVELDLKEEEHLKDQGTPARITVSVKLKDGPRPIFEYIIVTDLETLKARAGKNDIVVVDVMRDRNGLFVSILEDLGPIFEQEGFSAEKNWRYFSNYPEKAAESGKLQGFMKKQGEELVDYLYQKIMMDWVPP